MPSKAESKRMTGAQRQGQPTEKMTEDKLHAIVRKGENQTLERENAKLRKELKYLKSWPKPTSSNTTKVRAVSAMKRKAEESLEAFEVCLSPGAASVLQWLARRSGTSAVDYLEGVTRDYLRDILTSLDDKESEDLLSIGVREEVDRGKWYPGKVSAFSS